MVGVREKNVWLLNKARRWLKARRPHLALKLTNLQVLCGDCNAGKGNRDTTDWRPNPNGLDGHQGSLSGPGPAQHHPGTAPEA